VSEHENKFKMHTIGYFDFIDIRQFCDGSLWSSFRALENSKNPVKPIEYPQDEFPCKIEAISKTVATHIEQQYAVFAVCFHKCS